MKTLHLEKTGSDYVFWFNGFEKSTHKQLQLEIATFKAWHYDQKKKKCVYSEKDNEAINFQPFIYEHADKLGFKECHGCEISTAGLDMLPAPFNKRIKNTHENILKVVNDLTGENFDKIELVDVKDLNK